MRIVTHEFYSFYLVIPILLIYQGHVRVYSEILRLIGKSGSFRLHVRV